MGDDCESEKIRSYFGSAVIKGKGIQVEIMGNLQKRGPDGEWSQPTDLVRYRRWVEVGGMLLPVLALDYEYAAYLALGRTETARKIKAWLDLHECGHNSFSSGSADTTC